MAGLASIQNEPEVRPPRVRDVTKLFDSSEVIYVLSARINSNKNQANKIEFDKQDSKSS